MPSIKYLCGSDTCKKEFYSFYPSKSNISNTKSCPVCNGSATRQLGASAVKSVFTVDNGYQARAVELDLNVIESNKERSKKGYNRGD